MPSKKIITLRCPKILAEKLESAAEQIGTSVNGYLLELIAEQLQINLEDLDIKVYRRFSPNLINPSTEFID